MKLISEAIGSHQSFLRKGVTSCEKKPTEDEKYGLMSYVPGAGQRILHVSGFMYVSHLLQPGHLPGRVSRRRSSDFAEGHRLES